MPFKKNHCSSLLLFSRVRKRAENIMIDHFHPSHPLFQRHPPQRVRPRAANTRTTRHLRSFLPQAITLTNKHSHLDLPPTVQFLTNHIHVHIYNLYLAIWRTAFVQHTSSIFITWWICLVMSCIPLTPEPQIIPCTCYFANKFWFFHIFLSCTDTSEANEKLKNVRMHIDAPSLSDFFCTTVLGSQWEVHYNIQAPANNNSEALIRSKMEKQQQPGAFRHLWIISTEVKHLSVLCHYWGAWALTSGKERGVMLYLFSGAVDGRVLSPAGHRATPGLQRGMLRNTHTHAA